MHLYVLHNTHNITQHNTDSGKKEKEDDGSGLGTNELLKMLKFGADVICQSAGKQLSDDDIDAIVSRTAPASKKGGDASGGKKATSSSSSSISSSSSGKSKSKGQQSKSILQNQQHSALNYNPVAAPMETR